MHLSVASKNVDRAVSIQKWVIALNTRGQRRGRHDDPKNAVANLIQRNSWLFSDPVHNSQIEIEAKGFVQ